MAKRHNHYEAAFEAYLRQERFAYVAVDEQRRALTTEGSLKSLDYLVSIPGDDPWSTPSAWLVDVKGRRFPSGAKHPQYWRNWSTAEDLAAMRSWQDRFGGPTQSALVFAFHLVGDRSPTPPEEIFAFRDRLYAFVGIPIDDYAALAKPLSPKWSTVHLSAADFRRQARSLTQLFGGAVKERRSGG